MNYNPKSYFLIDSGTSTDKILGFWDIVLSDNEIRLTNTLKPYMIVQFSVNHENEADYSKK